MSSLTNRSVRLVVLHFIGQSIILERITINVITTNKISLHHVLSIIASALVCMREKLVLTVDAVTGGVADLRVEEPVPVPDASSPKESLAFPMNWIIVVSQVLATTRTLGLFVEASFTGCEEKNIIFFNTIIIRGTDGSCCYYI